MIKSTATISILLGAIVCLIGVQARSLEPQPEPEVDAVIPSPNQEFGDELAHADIKRTNIEPQQAEPSNEASVPVYVSPFARAERVPAFSAPAPTFDRQESSHAPPNYAPRPSASTADLKTSASYGHHHGHHGYDHSGWLDMGAWTGGKGSFGWYADYPVGGKHGHYGYGRK